MDKINRLDVMDDVEQYMTTPFSDTPEGYLSGRAILTNIGVFVYKDKSGKIIRELRPPEEVLHPASLATLKMKPVTNNHPKKEMVTSDNIKKYQVGNLGSEIWSDSYVVSAPLTITDGNTIQDIKSGKTALSCGYTAELEWSSGVWMGIPYDAIQRNIRYNHVSVVDAGRAGDLAKIRMDDGDFLLDKIIRFENKELEIPVQDNKKPERRKIMENTVDLRSIQLDGVPYQAEIKVIEKLHDVEKENLSIQKDLKASKDSIETLEKENATLEAERDTLKETLDSVQKELNELKESSIKEDEIQELVKNRISLVDTAVKMEIEVTDEMSNLDIKKAIITKIFPEAKLDEKSDDYVNARYDAAIEVAETMVNNANKKKVIQDTIKQDSDKSKEKTNYDSARQKYIADLETQYMKGE